MKNIFLFFFFFIYSCNLKTDVKQSVNDKMNLLDALLQNANWRLIDDADTSYMFFSRQGNGYFRVYQYEMDKGDSIHTRLSNITSLNDTVNWALDTVKLRLSKIDTTAATWDSKTGAFSLRKTNNNQLIFTTAEAKQIRMVKTAPIAGFLARHRDDYLKRISQKQNRKK